MAERELKQAPELQTQSCLLPIFYNLCQALLLQQVHIKKKTTRMTHLQFSKWEYLVTAAVAVRTLDVKVQDFSFCKIVWIYFILLQRLVVHWTPVTAHVSVKF